MNDLIYIVKNIPYVSLQQSLNDIYKYGDILLLPSQVDKNQMLIYLNSFYNYIQIILNVESIVSDELLTIDQKIGLIDQRQYPDELLNIYRYLVESKSLEQLYNLEKTYDYLKIYINDLLDYIILLKRHQEYDREYRRRGSKAPTFFTKNL